MRKLGRAFRKFARVQAFRGFLNKVEAHSMRPAPTPLTAAVTYRGVLYCRDCLPEGVSIESEEVLPVLPGSERTTYVPMCNTCWKHHDYAMGMSETPSTGIEIGWASFGCLLVAVCYGGAAIVFLALVVMALRYLSSAI